MVHSIPANVRVTVSPVSFFGNEYVVLVPRPTRTPQPLSAGSRSSRSRPARRRRSQALLSNLDHLLVELHPGQARRRPDCTFDRGSWARGPLWGRTSLRANRYLQGMLPLWPKVVADFEAFDPVANSFAAATPNVLQILANQTVTSKTINNFGLKRPKRYLGRSDAHGRCRQALQRDSVTFKILTADAAPFLEDLSQNPYEIAELLSGLGKFANAFLAAEANGPYLSATATVNVINPADLGVAILGGSPSTLIDAISAGLGSQYVNPPLYTAADCPRFGSLSNCGGVTTGGVAAGLVSKVLPAAAETEAVGQIYQSVAGRPPANATVSSLLLSPLLEGLVARS